MLCVHVHVYVSSSSSLPSVVLAVVWCRLNGQTIARWTSRTLLTSPLRTPRLPYPPIHSALFSLLPYRLLSSSRPLVCHAEDCCNVAISLSLRRFDYLRLLLRTLRSLTVSAACSDRSTTTQLLSAQLLRGQRLTAFAVHIHHRVALTRHCCLSAVKSQPRVGLHSLCVLRGCTIAKNTSNHHYLPQPTAANVSFHLSLPPLSLPSDWPTECVSSKDPEKTTEKKNQKNS